MRLDKKNDNWIQKWSKGKKANPPKKSKTQRSDADAKLVDGFMKNLSGKKVSSTLRERTIRLAYQKPELRPLLLPILRGNR